MREILKYPRTKHVQGSRLQHGDHDFEEVPWSELRGKRLIVEEKVDGANVGISFDGESMILQSRGHYLRGGSREKQFELLKTWSACHQCVFHDVLGQRYVMYGEWLYAKHTFFYDALPHYFMEFDVLDTEKNIFLSTEVRNDLLPRNIVKPVLVLADGKFDRLSDLSRLITRSHFITSDRRENLKLAAMEAGVSPDDAFGHTDLHDEMEGLYIKWEEDGEVKGRYKFVRGSFTNAILEQEEHWHDRPIIANRLVPGAYDGLFRG